MKKLLLITILTVISLCVFAQNQLSYIVANKYKVKETEQKWDSVWTQTDGDVYIYFDMGFGFASITNQNFDRFILTGMNEPIEIAGNKIIVINAIDDTGVGCELHTSFLSNGEFTLTVIYSNIQYSYLLGEENDGYPSKLFETNESDDTSKKQLGEKKQKTYNL